MALDHTGRTMIYISRKQSCHSKSLRPEFLIARQSHIFDFLDDLGLLRSSLRLWGQRCPRDHMRTALRRLFSEHEFLDLAILPSGT